MTLMQHVVRNLGDLQAVIRGTSARPNTCLGEILRRACLIDADQLRLALESQRRQRGKRLGRILVELKLVDQEQINLALAHKFGIPIVKLQDVDVAPDVLALVPPDLANQHNILPLGRIGERLVVATENPLDAPGIEALSFHTGLNVEPVMSPGRDITLALSKYYSRFDEHEALADVRLGGDGAQGGEPAHLIERRAKRKPIVRLLNAIVLQGLMDNASDINIRPGRADVAVYYRIDGRLQRARSLHKSLLAALVSRVKIIGQMNIAERRLPQDGHARLVRGGTVIDLRLSVLPTIHGESVVIRLLNKEAGLKPLAGLGLSDAHHGTLRTMMRRPHGLVLVTGPTGAGKTTTLYALLNEIKRHNAHILSIEDPVEYDMEDVEQVQVANVKGYTFATALRHLLRHDPDVIMVGEIRDEETARIANRAALTGHLVLSSMHTNDTVSSVTRLLDMGIEPYLLCATLAGVLAQRLVRVNCRRCKGAEEVDASLKAMLGIEEGQVFYRGRGCPACGHSGYRGRTLLYELLEVTPAFARMVNRQRPAHELREQALRQGMMTLSANGFALARRGVTSLSEVIDATIG